MNGTGSFSKAVACAHAALSYQVRRHRVAFVWTNGIYWHVKFSIKTKYCSRGIYDVRHIKRRRLTKAEIAECLALAAGETA